MREMVIVGGSTSTSLRVRRSRRSRGRILRICSFTPMIKAEPKKKRKNVLFRNVLQDQIGLTNKKCAMTNPGTATAATATDCTMATNAVAK